MSRQEVSIPTPEGEARAFVFTPRNGQGPWPAVIFYMDGIAIREGLFEMADRLASHGYYVLLPDMFWRLGPYDPLDPKKVFADPKVLRELIGKFMGSTDPERSMRDTAAFLDWLDKQPQAQAEKIGVTGYCMGAGMALRAAGTFPDRIAAAGAFHGGGLATDAPDSPHLLAPKIQAKVVVACADKDPYLPEEEFERLAKALEDAGVEGDVTIYRGAMHGYAPADTPVYDREASERHWRALFALLDEQLKDKVPA